MLAGAVRRGHGLTRGDPWLSDTARHQLSRPSRVAGPLLGRGPGLRAGATASGLRHHGQLAARRRAAPVLARPGHGLHHRSGWRRTSHLDPGRARPQDRQQPPPPRHPPQRRTGPPDQDPQEARGRRGQAAIRFGATLLSDLSEELRRALTTTRSRWGPRATKRHQLRLSGIMVSPCAAAEHCAGPQLTRKILNSKY